MNADSVTTIIPAYKPDKRMLTLVSALLSSGYRIVVVDDGSGDAFREIFNSLPKDVELYSHTVNKGKGEALKTAFRRLLDERASSVIVTCDADGQHTPADIARVADECIRRKDEGRVLVTGSRRFEGAVPFKSRFGNSFTRFSFKLATGVKLYDTQTGLRAFPASMLAELIEIPGSRYEYELNELLRLSAEGVKIVELPIQTVYLDGNKSSHFNAVRDSIRIYAGILKFCASSLIAFCVDYVLVLVIAALLSSMGGELKLLIASASARIISAAVNYTLNRSMVFRERGPVSVSAVKYVILALAVYGANYLALCLFNIVLHIPLSLAKLITELSLFTLSFMAQRSFVFKHKN